MNTFDVLQKGNRYAAKKQRLAMMRDFNQRASDILLT
jgi:hypothetical protein